MQPDALSLYLFTIIPTAPLPAVLSVDLSLLHPPALPGGTSHALPHTSGLPGSWLRSQARTSPASSSGPTRRCQPLTPRATWTLSSRRTQRVRAQGSTGAGHSTQHGGRAWLPHTMQPGTARSWRQLCVLVSSGAALYAEMLWEHRGGLCCASAPTPPCCAAGKMSKHMGDMAVGDTLDFKGPIPKYAYKANEKKHIGGAAGGWPAAADCCQHGAACAQQQLGWHRAGCACGLLRFQIVAGTTAVLTVLLLCRRYDRWRHRHHSHAAGAGPHPGGTGGQYQGGAQGSAGCCSVLQCAAAAGAPVSGSIL